MADPTPPPGFEPIPRPPPGFEPIAGPNSALAGSGEARTPRPGFAEMEEQDKLARAQHTASVVRDRRGNFVRKHLGELDEGAEFPVYKDAAGKELRINPDTDVILRDPVTNKRMVFARDAKTDIGTLDAAAHALTEGMAVGPVTQVVRRAGQAAQAADRSVNNAVARANALGLQSAGQMQAGERVRDLAAFENLGVMPFPPAFADKGMARTARTVEEMPSIVGATVKQPKTETLMDLGEAQTRIARDLGAPADDLAAGQVMQRGLERFGSAGVRDLDPGTLAGVRGVEQMRPQPTMVGPMPEGITSRAPVQPHPFMSGAALERATEAQPLREALGGGLAQTTRGVTVPAARRLDQAIIARRGAADLSEAELAALIRAPAAQTSFVSRQEALFERAWRSIPERFRVDASRNPERLAAVNTRAALAGIDQNIASQIAGQRTIAGPLAERLRNRSAHFDMNELRAMRTEVGRALSSLDPNQTRLNPTQLRQLYGAFSRDIEVGLQDIANRAYVMTRVSGNRPDRVAVEAARRADQALRDFRVADRYTRLGMERIGRFSRLVGTENPQDAVRMLGRYLRENTGNAQAVASVRSALRPEEWRSMVGHVVERMGKGRAGAQEAEAVWNPVNFATDWNKLKDSPAARSFFQAIPAETRQALDDLARAAERMKYYETTKNYSGTAYSGIPALTAAGAMVSGGTMAILGLIGQVGGAMALGKFLTSPRYLRTLATHMDREAGSLRRTATIPSETAMTPEGTAAAAIALNQLMRLAAQDEELAPVLRAVAEEMGVVEDAKGNRNVKQQARPH